MVRRPRAPVLCLSASRAVARIASGGEDQLHLVEVEELLVLLDDGVLRLGHDLDQRVLVQRLEHHHHGQAADELGDQAVLQQVFGDDLLLRLARLLCISSALEAEAMVLVDARCR